MIDQLLPFLGDLNLQLIVKGFVLLLLFGYSIFTFIIFIQIRALNRTVRIHAKQASAIVLFLAILYVVLSISLFVAALVIL